MRRIPEKISISATHGTIQCNPNHKRFFNIKFFQWHIWKLIFVAQITHSANLSEL